MSQLSDVDVLNVTIIPGAFVLVIALSIATCCCVKSRNRAEQAVLREKRKEQKLRKERIKNSPNGYAENFVSKNDSYLDKKLNKNEKRNTIDSGINNSGFIKNDDQNDSDIIGDKSSARNSVDISKNIKTLSSDPHYLNLSKSIDQLNQFSDDNKTGRLTQVSSDSNRSTVINVRGSNTSIKPDQRPCSAEYTHTINGTATMLEGSAEYRKHSNFDLEATEHSSEVGKTRSITSVYFSEKDYENQSPVEASSPRHHDVPPK